MSKALFIRLYSPGLAPSVAHFILSVSVAKNIRESRYVTVFLVTDYRFTAEGIESFVTPEGHEAFSVVNGGRPPSSLRSIRRGNRSPESVEGNAERAG